MEHPHGRYTWPRVVARRGKANGTVYSIPQAPEARPLGDGVWCGAAGAPSGHQRDPKPSQVHCNGVPRFWFNALTSLWS